MKTVLVLTLVALAACSPRISTERAAIRADQDRANNERYLEEKYTDENLCKMGGCAEIYNEKGQLIDVN